MDTLLKSTYLRGCPFCHFFAFRTRITVRTLTPRASAICYRLRWYAQGHKGHRGVHGFFWISPYSVSPRARVQKSCDLCDLARHTCILSVTFLWPFFWPKPYPSQCSR